MGSAASLTDFDLKKLQCLNDYFDCGIPLGELVKKYHRSRGTILDWTVKARHAGRKRTATTVQFGPKPNDKSEPLSLFHKRIGLHLYHWRMGLPDSAPANAAIVLGYSRNAYSKIESGQYDISLVEMLNFGKIIKMELQDLLKLKKESS